MVADWQVRIWNLRLLRDPELEANGSLPRSLAVLHDHFGPVNCVRWAFRGNLLASCGDDKLIHVYEIRAGPGAAVFGSSEKANIENWKLAITLHGHAADVVCTLTPRSGFRIEGRGNVRSHVSPVH